MAPRKPTLSQRKVIAGAGLDPERWSVRMENQYYLYLVDRGMEQRETAIIDRKTGKIVRNPSWPR